MTTNQLAAGYHRKCVDCLAALAVLVQRQAFSDVVRESQEIVELALKGMLRAVGIDPPKWHDVGDLLMQYGERFPQVERERLVDLAAASKLLRKEREFSFYGDIDFIPTDEYDAEDANRAAGYAALATATATLGIVLETLRQD